MSQTRIFNKTTLGFALALQVVLIGALLAARSGAVSEPEPFLAFDAATIDALSVSNDEGSVSLAKVNDAWQLPDGLPADGSKVRTRARQVRRRSRRLAGGEQGIHRGALRGDGGQPPAPRRHSVRRRHAGGLLSRHLPRLSQGPRPPRGRGRKSSPSPSPTTRRGWESSDWLDKSLLRPEGALVGVERVDGFALTKDGRGRPGSRADGTMLDQGKAETFAGRFTGLSVLGVSDAELPEAPKMAFALTDDSGTQTLRIYHLEADDDYVAQTESLARGLRDVVLHRRADGQGRRRSRAPIRRRTRRNSTWDDDLPVEADSP